MDAQVIVIGGGPGGSTAATVLAKRGRSVILLERETFPRFQIGESLLPYNNDLFKELGVWDEISRAGFYPKYGAEFLTGDGKVGYRFRFGRTLPPEYSMSWQVCRADFDHILLRNAARAGVDVRERSRVKGVDLSDPERAVVRYVTPDGATASLTARTVVDASGLGCVVAREHGERVMIEGMKKVSFFAHYRNVVPSAEGDASGNVVIVVIRDAWFWMIPLTRELTSVGLVLDRDIATGSGLSPEALLARTIEATPYVAKRMENATRETEVHSRRDFSYRMRRSWGPNFALVGDSAGFIDPIFSTGVFLSMKSAALVAEGVDHQLETGSDRELATCHEQVNAALTRYLEFIENFYCREFVEVFLQPSERFGLLPVVIGVLAGRVFEGRGDWLKLRLFFTLVKMQRQTGAIAPAIPWDELPAPARALTPEGTLA
jgi:flavin-dependent dehydrogenase